MYWFFEDVDYYRAHGHYVFVCKRKKKPEIVEGAGIFMISALEHALERLTSKFTEAPAGSGACECRPMVGIDGRFGAAVSQGIDTIISRGFLTQNVILPE